jgi:hypothetical protein
MPTPHIIQPHRGDGSTKPGRSIYSSFPQLKIVCSEFEMSWVPGFMTRLDQIEDIETIGFVETRRDLSQKLVHRHPGGGGEPGFHLYLSPDGLGQMGGGRVSLSLLLDSGVVEFEDGVY